VRPALLTAVLAALAGALAVSGCKPHPAMPPPAGPDQSVHDAMVLVCDAPSRASSEHAATRSDAIAAHLTDGVGNPKVLSAAEGWKTDGIDRKQIDALIKEAKLSSCALRDEQ
jgi:hypothetical protein